MPVVLRVVGVLLLFGALVGAGYALSAITGLEVGVADLIVAAVFAAVVLPLRRALRA